MSKTENFYRYIFILDCITYKKIGAFEVKVDDLHEISLDPGIHSSYGVPRKVKDLQALLDWGGYDNWEDHSPFNFDDFYKYAKQIEIEENTFFVSE